MKEASQNSSQDWRLTVGFESNHDEQLKGAYGTEVYILKPVAFSVMPELMHILLCVPLLRKDQEVPVFLYQLRFNTIHCK